MRVASKTEDYHLPGGFLDQGLKDLGYSREDLNVELFASDRHPIVDLNCRKGQNYCYKFYGPSLRMAYENPRFIERGRILSKVALEPSPMVLCSPNSGAHGGKSTGVLYWRG